MTLTEAKAAILTLVDYLDGKPSLVLKNVWKRKLAEALIVLKANNTYAQSENGMYTTILISKVNGTASVGYLPIKEEGKSSSGDSLDEMYLKMLTAQSSSTPASDTAPDLSI